MRRALVALVAACGGAAPAAAPPSNHVAAAAGKRQKLGTMVIEEYSKCQAPHHVTIAIDGVTRATIMVPCRVAPVPHNGIIVTDTSAHVVEGPAVELEAGKHEVMIRDRETGLVARLEATFPAYGSLSDPRPPTKELPVDVLFVIVHVDWIRADGVVRANMILM